MPSVTAVLLAISIALTTGATAQVVKPGATPSPTGRLPAPAQITAAQQPDGSIRVVWRAVDGAVRYYLTRSVPPTGAARVSLPNAPDTVYIDRDVKPGSSYYYLVAGIDEAGVTGLKASAPPVTAVAPSTSDTATTPPQTTSAPALAAPTNVVAAPYPYMEPTVTWQSSEARARFLVERRVPQTDPNAGWEQIQEGSRSVASGHWKCCVAHDLNTLASKNLEYRVTAVDTVVTASKSPPVVSNTIVNWPIMVDPPVLSDISIRVGESKRLPWPAHTSDLENLQWVSLSPSIVSVDLALGIVTALARGQGFQGYIVASGIARNVYVGTWIWRVNVEP